MRNVQGDLCGSAPPALPLSSAWQHKRGVQPEAVSKRCSLGAVWWSLSRRHPSIPALAIDPMPTTAVPACPITTGMFA